MARKVGKAAGAPGAAPAGAAASLLAFLALLAPIGALLAVALPFVVFSLASPESLAESKVLGQAAGAALLLVGIACLPAGAVRSDARGPGAGTGALAGRIARLALAALALCVVASALAAAPGLVDPYGAVPVLATAALFAWGASRASDDGSARLLGVLAAAGALTGGLAALQRWAGLFRLPLDVKEDRFWASALIGNPGDVAASLVLPCLLLWAALDRWSELSSGKRLLLLAGLAATGAGILASSSVTPLVAVAAGVLLFTLASPRRRAARTAAGAGVLALALLLSGTGSRLVEKAGEAGEGRLGAALTQRDIGYLSALEMVRDHPLLGAGPGRFAAAFVPARLAAEARTGRRLVHASASAQFENAHCDPLTLAAECGVPAALAALVLAGALVAGLAGRLRAERAEPGSPPAEVLLVLLSAAAVLSLASFPARIPSASGPIAFVAGLAFRRVGGVAPLPAAGRLRRAAALVAALALLLLEPLRASATWLQTAGERRARLLSALPPGLKADLAAEASRSLERSLALRPRHATAHLAYGTVLAATGDLDGAEREFLASLRLEERPETLLDLGRLAAARGHEGEARAYFLRAVWVFPALVSAVPDGSDPEGIRQEVKELAGRLGRGAEPPGLPTP